MNARHPTLSLYLPNLDGGGAERMMVNLAAGFAARGFATDLVLAEAKGPYLELVSPDVRVIDLASSGVSASLPKLVRYLRRNRPAALLATLNHASVIALLARALAGVPTRTVIRESNMLFPKQATSLKGLSLRTSVRLFYPWADAHVAVSQGVADDLARFMKTDMKKIHTIYNPVVTEELFRRAKQRPEHPWFAPGEPPVILGVGRLAPQKDFPTLIRAFATVCRERPARLLILGEGNQRAELGSLAQSLGVADAVALPGFVDNPFAYMAHADTFVLSSKFEGLPGALIQAMACGSKVVSTDCPSGPFEILAGGRLAPLVPVGDPDALAAAMLESLSAPPNPALQTRACDFTEARILPQYLSVLLPETATDDRARQD